MSKISNEVVRIDNFRALARKLSFLPTELDIFDIRQHYVRSLFLSPSRWHPANTESSSTGILGTEPDYFPTQQPLLSNLRQK